MRLRSMLALVSLAGMALAACSPAPSFSIDYESFTLDNGLEVILHEDRSDPITSVAVLYHVGSNREEPGRTGFAHLFEHMMFQESQHVGQDQFFKKVQDAGGTLNGGTSFDQTIYFEIVPRNALEMALWLESDRMGYLLSTVTEEAFINQQGVVQNEKRQGVDNRPYGHTNFVIHKLLYPEGHPYNWQVIGSLEDLQNASVEDVRAFFRKWYGPNNATLVVAGDFDAAQTREWIEKYFGELASPDAVPDPEPRPVTLSETRRAFHEDNFASSPELTMVFPSVEQFQDDSYALQLLGRLLSDGKDAPLYKVLVEDEKLAPSVSAVQRSNEIAGAFRIRIRAFPNVDLDDVESAIVTALARFEEEGFTDADLDRIKAQTETRFYNGISSVLGKSFQLALYNELAGSAGFITEDIQNSLDVTMDDVWRVYNQYIKDKNFVQTSFVPREGAELATAESERAAVVEEAITPIQAPTLELAREPAAPLEPLPSSFDRSIEPAKGPVPEITLPDVWSHTYDNGLRLYGVEHRELPLVQVSLTLRGGMMLDDPDKVGVANLMTDILMEGTANKTPLELERAIDELGAFVNMFTTRQSITIRANTLASRLEDTYALVEEILLEPRWDEDEFARIKQETIENINRQSVNPASVASNVYNKLLYGSDHIWSNPTMGTAASVESITMDDMKAFYESKFSPSVTHVAVVGDISESDAIALFGSLGERWEATDVQFPALPDPPAVTESSLYFVDIPNARQSEIRIGYLALAQTDPDFYPATVMNYQLGGSFNGRVNMILREEKGYTYGARAGFAGSHHPGPFTASAAVVSNATFESVEIFRDELAKYREGVSDEDLAFTQNALVLSNARRFETLGAIRSMINQIAEYGRPLDYVKQREEIARNMTLGRHRELAQQYIDPDRMIYLVVGDANTQLGRLRQLGMGDPVVLDREGNPVGGL
ncbi:MAG: pitrilysin family protein [Gemmatimonadetes bacterium]|nr:pitrilysin family protein [Gemmatimonadota bacterium]